MSWLKDTCLLVLVSCVFGGNNDRPSSLPCKYNDPKCLAELVQWIYSTNVRGVPELGIESTDPLKHEVIHGDLGLVKYTLSNTVLEGMTDCLVENVKINSNLTNLHLGLRCPAARVSGEYTIEGNLLGIPVIGDGLYSIGTTNFYSTMDLGISYYRMGNKLYHKHPNYSYEGELLGDLTIDLKNSDGSKKDLPEGVKDILKFAKDNGKVFVNMIGTPVHNENAKRIMKNMNKRLKHIPTLELIQINEQLVKMENV